MGMGMGSEKNTQELPMPISSPPWSTGSYHLSCVVTGKNTTSLWSFFPSFITGKICILAIPTMTFIQLTVLTSSFAVFSCTCTRGALDSTFHAHSFLLLSFLFCFRSIYPSSSFLEMNCLHEAVRDGGSCVSKNSLQCYCWPCCILVGCLL